MKPSIYEIPIDQRGRLFQMPKPSGEWLREDIAHYADLGVTKLVSLIEVDEARELGLLEEPQICRAAGLDFASFPIEDYGLPARDDFIVFADHIRGEIENGARVAVHCRAGIGRSGTLSCTIIAPWLGSAEKAIAHVSHARGVEVPDTKAQRAFILDIAEQL